MSATGGGFRQFPSTTMFNSDHKFQVKIINKLLVCTIKSRLLLCPTDSIEGYIRKNHIKFLKKIN